VLGGGAGRPVQVRAVFVWSNASAMKKSEKKDLSGLRKLCKDSDYTISIIAFAMECAIRYACDKNGKLPGIGIQIKSVACLLKAEIERDMVYNNGRLLYRKVSPADGRIRRQPTKKKCRGAFILS